MCDTCGCGDPDVLPVAIQESILSANDRLARHNREHFDAQGILAINLMGSPGSGKTALLEATARALAGRRRVAAVSGDLATDNDGARLRAAGIPSLSITTGTACHLDARLVHDALHKLNAGPVDMLFIENVGNLVCPAIYDLGEAANVVALSVTEGEDKPLKYPVMFRKADLVILTKTDLVPHLPGFRRDALDDALRRTMPTPRVIAVSSTTGQGIAEWLAWLDERRASRPARPATAAHAHHDHSHDHHHD